MSVATLPAARRQRAPRGNERTCKGWIQEAALRMLLNNLDPEVAEDPDRLVVYGGSGRAARSWEAFDTIVAALRKLENDETLLVQSGKAVGVFQGQDLFDQRTSLIQYAELFNAFPEVTFCISVLTSGQNQELASYAWIFPNVVTSGHWWYSNVPAFIEADLRARLEAVPKVKQIGYYSDAYKLEFVLPKFTMYRRCLARVLADQFVRTGRLTETQAADLGRTIPYDNPRRIFGA